MKALIEEINDKLKVIINELLEQKTSVEKNLEEVQEKIDSKIEEAKTYKLEVDNSKERIADLEKEIADLENDLRDLTLKFSGKDLNAILDTANKEINIKIGERQQEINKQKEKINEFAEKARMIKDLLINLKKDKESKTFRLNNLTETYNYYNKELTRIIEFSSENAEELNEKVMDYAESLDDNEIDQEIEPKDIELNESDINNAFDYNFMNEETNEETNEAAVEEKEPESKLENVDFKALNDTIDQEYANIFGSSDDIKIADNSEADEGLNEGLLVKDDNSTEENVFDNNDTKVDLFGLENGFDADFLNKAETPVEPSAPDDVEQFFNSNGLDFNRFSDEGKETLRQIFDLTSCTKTIDVLRNNNIDLDGIYNAVDLFRLDSVELETIINKLLLAGQTTKNISLVLNALPMISSKDLQDVIDSYGDAIKDANITDLILKAKHLKELGGN